MTIDWLTLAAARRRLEPTLYAYLADDGSLTRRVRNACRGEFQVRLIDHKTVRPRDEEYALLALDESDRALARQVFLCCDQQPLVFARTIIGLTPNNRLLVERIDQLGEDSLGSILFRDPLASKRQMWLASVAPDDPFFQPVMLGGEAPVWVRRSLYEYEGCELIVYEAFISFDA